MKSLNRDATMPNLKPRALKSPWVSSQTPPVPVAPMLTVLVLAMLTASWLVVADGPCEYETRYAYGQEIPHQHRVRRIARSFRVQLHCHDPRQCKERDGQQRAEGGDQDGGTSGDHGLPASTGHGEQSVDEHTPVADRGEAVVAHLAHARVTGTRTAALRLRRFIR